MKRDARRSAERRRGLPRIVALASRLLDDDERDAVCGDLQENAVTSGRALVEVLGVVGRRQLLAWTGWRPWVTVAVVIAPLGTLLSITSTWWAYVHATYIWLYLDNWTPAYLDSAGSRQELAAHAGSFLLASCALASWSWTAGFVLGALARRAAIVCGVLFALVVFGGFSAVPASGANAVLALTFYRVAFPLLVRMLLVVVPAMWGMRVALRRRALPPRRAIACALVLFAVTVSTAPALEVSATVWLNVRSPWLSLAPLAMLWPAGYILVTAKKVRSCDAVS